MQRDPTRMDPDGMSKQTLVRQADLGHCRRLWQDPCLERQLGGGQGETSRQPDQ